MGPRAVVGAAATATATAKEAWVKSLADALGPGDGLAACQRALDEARAAVLEVADRFNGTLPPPPWPAGPALVKARQDVETLRDGFEVWAKKAPQVRWPLKTGKVGPQLQAYGSRLYDEVAKLQNKADALPKLDPKALIPSAGLALLSSPLVVLGVIYLLFRGKL
jgi:hypothetical protein